MSEHAGVERHDPAGIAWTINDEFAQRLGCGVSAAVVLPAWFLLLLFVVETAVALAVTAVLCALAVSFAALALRRARRLPRTVWIGEDGTIATEARAGRRRRPLAELRRIDIGTSLGVWPMRLGFDDGTVWRLPTELVDLEGFLATVRRLVPAVVIVDHNPPDAGARGDTADPPGGGTPGGGPR